MPNHDEDSDLPVADQATTLVGFRLTTADGGTLLTITESGFDALPDHRRLKVLRDNTEGWNIQAANIAAHVANPGSRPRVPRLAVLARLGDGRPRSIAELTEGTGLTRQGVSKHLTILERAGVVASERIGRESRYAIRTDGFDAARRYLEQAARQWDDALERLRRHVEE